MQFNLTVKMDNAAFEDDSTTEMAGILAQLARRMESWGPLMGEDSGAVRDTNGNTVGRWEVTES